MTNITTEVQTQKHTRGAILFYDRQRRIGLKRMPLGSPFMLPRVGELVKLPIENDVATEYCVVDIRYLYRDEEEAPSLGFAGPTGKATTSEKPEQRRMQLECVRIELDPLL